MTSIGHVLVLTEHDDECEKEQDVVEKDEFIDASSEVGCIEDLPFSQVLHLVLTLLVRFVLLDSGDCERGLCDVRSAVNDEVEQVDDH